MTNVPPPPRRKSFAINDLQQLIACQTITKSLIEIQSQYNRILRIAGTNRVRLASKWYENNNARGQANEECEENRKRWTWLRVLRGRGANRHGAAGYHHLRRAGRCVGRRDNLDADLPRDGCGEGVRNLGEF